MQQGIIAGCAGGNYTNVVEAARLLKGKNIGDGAFALSVYPSSQPVFINLTRQGYAADLMEAGAIVRTAFCGPCFGAGDTPCNNGLSVRHTTRNFPNREGSKPGNGQMAAVALMDARSIAATAARGGILTSAEEFDGWGEVPEYTFDPTVYERRVYQGFGKANAIGQAILVKASDLLHLIVHATEVNRLHIDGEFLSGLHVFIQFHRADLNDLAPQMDRKLIKDGGFGAHGLVPLQIHHNVIHRSVLLFLNFTATV